jgi:hypothetical protein
VNPWLSGTSSRSPESRWVSDSFFDSEYFLLYHGDPIYRSKKPFYSFILYIFFQHSLLYFLYHIYRSRRSLLYFLYHIYRSRNFLLYFYTIYRFRDTFYIPIPYISTRITTFLVTPKCCLEKPPDNT